MKKAHTITRRPSQVKKTPDGQLYVRCSCGKREHLGMYGAAHLGAYELVGQCRCGNTIIITRSTP